MNAFDMSDICYLKQIVISMDCSSEGSGDADCDCDGVDGS